MGVTTVLISANGRVVAFDSGSGNLVDGDGDVAHDVFVRDLEAGRTEGITTRRPTDTFTGNSLLNSISGDGRFVGFESTDVTLVRNDRNGFFSDVFVFDRDAAGCASSAATATASRATTTASAPSSATMASSSSSARVRAISCGATPTRPSTSSVAIWKKARPSAWPPTTRIDEFRPFGFEVVATDITPRARKVALLTRADLEPEQDVGFFVADVYVLETRERR